MPLTIIILAAGEGKRMFSATPKVLHKLAGKPILQHIIDTAYALKPNKVIIVHGHNAEQVRQTINDDNLHWVEQAEQLGTGHATIQALPLIDDDDQVLILYGDGPLISEDTLQQLIANNSSKHLTLLLAKPNDPHGLGRIIRNEKQQVIGIVEQRDATPEQCQINEIYSGIMIASAQFFKQQLAKLNNNNAQSEYYITDLIAQAVQENGVIQDVITPNPMEIQGINNRKQLAQCERYYQQQYAERLMMQGVTLADPLRFDCRGELIVGKDVFIDINAVIEGTVTLGHNVSIGPNVYLRDCTIGDDVQIHANSVIEESQLAEQCTIGPFARLRPGTELAKGAKVGNYVEVKKSLIGAGSKVNHLTYIGDTTIGAGVNVGAGTITCNYDGVNKHSTIIEDNVFIGSGTQLIAPITIGAGATIGAGSTVRKNAPSEQLTLCKSEQISVKSWKRPQKKST